MTTLGHLESQHKMFTEKEALKLQYHQCVSHVWDAVMMLYTRVWSGKAKHTFEK